ncbi:MAG TPA: hypothetical protein VGO21_05715 [Candidatus Paceibacterota bacterium]|nr:hypothetical protein [Candidatus Paceibacterota bacterium]
MESAADQQQQGGKVEMVNNPEWENVMDDLLRQFIGLIIGHAKKLTLPSQIYGKCY